MEERAASQTNWLGLSLQSSRVVGICDSGHCQKLVEIMNTHIDIGGREALSLKGALLVYRGSRQSFVAWHEAKNTTDGAPFLGEAQPLTTEFVQGLAQGLGTRIPVEILSENVLVRTAEAIVWWTPAAHRTMFFRATSDEGAVLNGKRFPHPPLLWLVRGRELWVRAMDTNARPTSATKLSIAPYWNVDGESGLTCQGSMRSPEADGVSAIPLWEQAFFQSEFTHQTGSRKLTTHLDGFLGLWAGLAGSRRPFPVEHLAPVNQTLLEFVMKESR